MLDKTHKAKPLVVEYKNWRNEVSTRSIIPLRVYFGSNEWHPDPQWLIEALDVDKDMVRIFAMRDMKF